jgi:hypothetical protein
LPTKLDDGFATLELSDAAVIAIEKVVRYVPRELGVQEVVV